MPKRQRRSPRERRAASASSTRTVTHDRPVATPTRRSYSGSQRAGAPVRPGAARAAGEPSAVLEREAAQERAYVVKDFRRIGVVIAIMVALLVVADFAVNALLP